MILPVVFFMLFSLIFTFVFKEEVTGVIANMKNEPVMVITLIVVFILLYMLAWMPAILGNCLDIMKFKKKYNVKSLYGVRCIGKSGKVTTNYYNRNKNEYGDCLIYVDEYKLYLNNTKATVRCVGNLRAAGVYIEPDNCEMQMLG